jgi:hypothetical protein
MNGEHFARTRQPKSGVCLTGRRDRMQGTASNPRYLSPSLRSLNDSFTNKTKNVNCIILDTFLSVNTAMYLLE